jgi:hypothetical protein
MVELRTATLGERLSPDISKTAGIEPTPGHAPERVNKPTFSQDQIVRVSDFKQKDFEGLRNRVGLTRMVSDIRQ